MKSTYTIPNTTKTCPKCNGPIVDCDSEWLGEIQGSGTGIISGGDCVDCGQHFVYDRVYVLTGM